MSVTKLETTCWQDDVHDATATESPTWEQVETAIRALDGRVYDSVLLQGPGESYMGVVGGDSQRFVVAGFLDGKGPFILSLGAAGKGPCAISVGGQDNEYAADEVVSLEDALTVARTFFERAECDAAYEWKERATNM